MRFKHLIFKHKSSKNERGMASMIYILLITLIASFLGLGFDAALGNYTANGLKSIADTATLTASGKTKYSANKQIISTTSAKETFIQNYSNYRQSYPNVVKGGKAQIKVTFSKDGRSITTNVTEVSATRFMALIGTPKITYKIKSTARLGSLYEKENT